MAAAEILGRCSYLCSLGTSIFQTVHAILQFDISRQFTGPDVFIKLDYYNPAKECPLLKVQYTKS